MGVAHPRAAQIGAEPLTCFRGELPMLSLVKNFSRHEGGATAIEYGLIAALIAVVIIGAVTAVGTSLSTTFTTVSGSLK
jgi:pilus assembly protein Flp/PilA